MNDDFRIVDEDLPATPNRWPPQLVFDLALGLDDYPTLENRFNLDSGDLDRLFALAPFRAEVANLTRELHENNSIFKYKAKAQAETYLEELDHLMGLPDTAPSVKLSIFQTLAKYGELEPLPPKAEAQTAALAPGQAMRMVVEWVGGPKDMSPVSNASAQDPPQPPTLELQANG